MPYEHTSVLGLEFSRKIRSVVGSNHARVERPKCLEDCGERGKCLYSVLLSANSTSSVKQPALHFSYFSTLRPYPTSLDYQQTCFLRVFGYPQLQHGNPSEMHSPTTQRLADVSRTAQGPPAITSRSPPTTTQRLADISTMTAMRNSRHTDQ